MATATAKKATAKKATPAKATQPEQAQAQAQPAKAAPKPFKLAAPAKKMVPINLDKLTWHRDPTTVKAEYANVTSTVGDWLASMGVYQFSDFDSRRIVTTEAQRTILKISPSSKKASMMRHVVRGGPVPQVIMTVRGDRLSPLDGLQRADVHTMVAMALLHIKSGVKEADVHPVVAEAIRKVKEHKHDITDLDSYLTGPMTVQIWRGLSEKEEDEKFGVWNLDATHISKTHMTEILHGDLRARISSIGIKTETEKERNTPVVDPETGSEVSKPRRKKGDAVPPGEVVRPLAAVQINLAAYLTGMLKTGRNTMLEEGTNGRLHTRWEHLGDAIVSEDFGWFYGEALPWLHKVYDESTSAAGKQIRTESEAFTVPFLAALGYARQEGIDPEKVKEWKDGFVELLAREEVDVLRLWTGDESFGEKREGKELKGSAGIKDRKLWFHAIKNSIVKGLPLDWEAAYRDASNN